MTYYVTVQSERSVATVWRLEEEHEGNHPIEHAAEYSLVVDSHLDGRDTALGSQLMCADSKASDIRDEQTLYAIVRCTGKRTPLPRSGVLAPLPRSRVDSSHPRSKHPRSQHPPTHRHRPWCAAQVHPDRNKDTLWELAFVDADGAGGAELVVQGNKDGRTTGIEWPLMAADSNPRDLRDETSLYAMIHNDRNAATRWELEPPEPAQLIKRSVSSNLEGARERMRAAREMERSLVI